MMIDGNPADTATFSLLVSLVLLLLLLMLML